MMILLRIFSFCICVPILSFGVIGSLSLGFCEASSIMSPKWLNSSANYNSTESGDLHGRNGKFFPFPLMIMLSYDTHCRDDKEDGICLNNEKECLNMDGRVNSGYCFRGFGQGVCCQINSACAEHGGSMMIKRNKTRIKVPTPGLPGKTCVYNIPRKVGTCQLRIDFKDFSLSTSEHGECRANRLTIEGDDDLGRFELCGDVEPKTHMYLNYGVSDSISLSLNFSKKSKSRLELEISFIGCNSPYRAPHGCTQFFTSPMEEVKSFNFPKQQINNQRYMICVRSAPGKKLIKWRKCSSKDNVPQFFISGTLPRIRPFRHNDRHKVFPEGLAAGVRGDRAFELGRQMEGDQCAGDFVSTLGESSNKICGQDFEGINSSAKPFQLFVSFDESEGFVQVRRANTTTNDSSLGNQTQIGRQGIEPEDSLLDEGTDVDLENTGFCLRYSVT